MRWIAPFLLLLAVGLAGPGCAAEDGDDGDDDSMMLPAGPDAAPGDKLPFMSPCATNDECETGLCFPFNNKGPHCSHECMSSEECEAPSPGCNGMGVCKVP